MGRIERQKRKLIEESNKRLLGESYSGIIKKGDDICEIICKRKVAKVGSSGDVVKMIQHLLVSNGVNVDYEGGGMKSGCSQEWPSCDGIFKSHTKDAVKEFQRKIMGSGADDGVVGYNTWKAMCDKLDFTISMPKSKFCKDCQCDDNPPLSGDPVRNQPIIGDEFPPEKFVEDGNWWDFITDPLEDIWDWIITPAPGDGNSEEKNCDKVNACVKYAMGKDIKNWEYFLTCIGKKIKNPIEKDNPNPKKSCEGCPPWTNRMPGTGQKPMSPFIKSCVDKGCTKMAF